MALQMEQLYQLRTELGAFFLFDSARLQHRKGDSGLWSMTDFQKEFQDGDLIAFQTSAKENFTLKFVQRPLTELEKKVLVAQHTFFYKVHQGRLYWDDGQHLPCAEGFIDPQDDPDGWLELQSGEYKVTVYSQDWYTIPDAERESSGDISHYVVQFETYRGETIPVPGPFLPWLPPSKNWHDFRTKESPSLVSLYNRHICMSFDKQMRLAAWLEQAKQKASSGGLLKGMLKKDKPSNPNTWSYTTSTATLELGGTTFQAFELGSYAFPDNSWFWSWHNPSRKLTDENRKLQESIESIGTKHGISAFSIPAYFNVDPFLGFELSEAAADVFAAIAVSELGFNAYYKMPFQYGHGVALIRDERLAFIEQNPIRRMMEIIPQTFMSITVPNHRAACVGYAKAYGVSVKEQNNTVTISKGDEHFVAAFDDLNRLVDLKAHIGARS